MGFRVLVALMVGAGMVPGASFAVRDVSVVDVESGVVVPHQTIVVRGERIVSVGRGPVPAGFRVVNGAGKFLIPGLWDMHVHLWFEQNQLPAYAAAGITGVRDMGSDFGRVTAWRKLPGAPHVVTSGPPVMGTASDEPKLPVLVAVSPEEARRAVDQLEEMGVDFIKVLSNLPREAYVALAERARKEEIDFSGHVPNSITVWDAVEARQNSIEHMFGMTKAMADDPEKPLETFSETKLREFSERSALMGTWQTPTLTLWQRMIVDDPENAAVLKKQFDLVRRMVVLMQRFGVGLLAGTDTGDPRTTPGVTLHDELSALVACGLTPAEALRTATVNPAKFLGWEESAGRIREGYLADFVLLYGNPLEDIRQVRRNAGVSIRGRWSR